MSTPNEVLSYWLDEVGAAGWYVGGDAIDAEIRARFEEDWHRAKDGGLSDWLTSPRGTLAYICVVDQFARNMFRGTSDAFRLDSWGLAAAKIAVARGWDLQIPEPERQFFYLPLMHSENLCDQDRCVRLMKTRLTETGADNLLHAKVHRELIRRFGRFPGRNAALGRKDAAGETEFVETGGYGATLERMRSAA